MKNVQLLGSRILIERDEVSETTASGIAVVLDVIEDQLTGTVRAVGPGRIGPKGELIPLTVMEGDKVYFETGTRVTIKDKEFIVCMEKNILLILKPDTETKQPVA